MPTKEGQWGEGSIAALQGVGALPSVGGGGGDMAGEGAVVIPDS